MKKQSSSIAFMSFAIIADYEIYDAILITHANKCQIYMQSHVWHFGDSCSTLSNHHFWVECDGNVVHS